MKLSVLSRWCRASVLLLPVAALLGLSACDEAEVPAVLEIPQESQGYFNDGISFPATPAGGNLTVKVSFTPSVDWTATVDADETKAVPWLTVSPSAGKAGKAEITITAEENTVEQPRSAKVTLTCGDIIKFIKVAQQAGSKPSTSFTVKVDPTSAQMAVGETLQLTATATSSDPVAPQVTWSSSNDKVATVTPGNDVALDGTYIPGGLVTAVAEGEAIITAKAGDAEATCKITVTAGGSATVESLSITPAPVTLAIDEEQILTAVLVPSEAKATVEWKSDNPDIVAVGSISDNQAKIQGMAPGKTTVMAIAGGKTATCEVTVEEGSSQVAVESITLDPTSLELHVGQSAQINATVLPENATNKNLIWTSSDIYKVYVVNGGQVTAYGICEAIITVTSASNSEVTATCKVTVTEETVEEIVDLGLSVKWRAWNLGATKPEEYGDYFAWGETAPKAEYWRKDYKWWSADLQALTKYVDDETAAAEGGNHKADNLMKLDLEDDAANVILGEDWHLPTKADVEELCANCDWDLVTVSGVKGFKFTSKINGKSIFLPGAGYKYNNGFKLNDNDFGKYWANEVNQGGTYYAWNFHFETSAFNGALIAGPGGQARENGLTIRPVKGNVVEVASVSLSETEFKLEVGQTKQLTATVLPDNASYKTVVWYSENGMVATVENGLVTAVEVGEATIVAKVGGKTAECKVTVKPASPEPSLPVPEAVDLGLSVKWASCNLGATEPEQSGYYYAWGETSPKSEYTKDNYKFYKVTYVNAANTTYDLTKYCSDSHFGYVDGKKTLDLEDDAAYMNLGGNWRIPTFQEAVDLLNQCTWTFDKDKHGYHVKGPSGNSIFLPQARHYEGSKLEPTIYEGEYWTNYLDTDSGAKIIEFYDEDEWNPVRAYYDGRYKGLTIRPVRDDN